VLLGCVQLPFVHHIAGADIPIIGYTDARTGREQLVCRLIAAVVAFRPSAAQGSPPCNAKQLPRCQMSLPLQYNPSFTGRGVLGGVQLPVPVGTHRGADIPIIGTTGAACGVSVSAASLQLFACILALPAGSPLLEQESVASLQDSMPLQNWPYPDSGFLNE